MKCKATKFAVDIFTMASRSDFSGVAPGYPCHGNRGINTSAHTGFYAAKVP